MLAWAMCPARTLATSVGEGVRQDAEVCGTARFQTARAALEHVEGLRSVNGHEAYQCLGGNIKMFPQLGPGRMPGSYIIASVAEVTLADGAKRLYRMMNSARYTPEVLAQVLTSVGWETIYSAGYDARTAVSLLRRS